MHPVACGEAIYVGIGRWRLQTRGLCNHTEPIQPHLGPGRVLSEPPMPGQQSGLREDSACAARGGLWRRGQTALPFRSHCKSSGVRQGWVGQCLAKTPARSEAMGLPAPTTLPLTHLQPGGLGLGVAKLGPRLLPTTFRGETPVWLPLGPSSTTPRTSWATFPFFGIFQGSRGAEQRITIFAQMMRPLADGGCLHG